MSEQSRFDDSVITASNQCLPGMVSGSVTVPILHVANASFPRRLWLAAFLLSLGFLPSIIAYGLNLWTREAYQFFPLALLGVAILAWDRLSDEPAIRNSHSNRVGYVILTTSGLCLGFASFVWSPWLGSIATIMALIGLSWILGGWTLTRSLTPAFLMLLILIRPPLNMDLALTEGLRRLAVRLSSCLLDTVFTVPHYVSGNVIELSRQRLLVEEACSGINSTLYVIAFSLFWGLWRRRSIPHVVLLSLASPTFVLLGNLFRIAGAGALNYHHHIDILAGWKHQAIALVLFAFYMALVFSTDSLLAFFTTSDVVPKPKSSSRDGWKRVHSSLNVRMPAMAWRWVLTIAICSAFLGVVQGVNAWGEIRKRRVAAGTFARVKGSVPTSLQQGAQFDLPLQISGWQQIVTTNVNSRFLELEGIYTRAWVYSQGRLTASVALDYPYAGYHDLRLCYMNQGWTIRETAQVGKAPEDLSPYVAATMSKKPLLSGFLLFGGFNGAGKWVTELDTTEHPLASRFGVDAPMTTVSTYEVQVLVVGYSPHNEAEKRAVLELFSDVRNRLATQVLKHLGQNP